MPIDAHGSLVDQTPMSTQSADITTHAPPNYGDHWHDPLWDGIEQTGFMTPAPQSGMNTPFGGLSRNGSSENLPSLDSLAQENGVTPAALSSRLQGLDLTANSRNSSFLRRQTGIAPGEATPQSIPAEEPTTADHPEVNLSASAPRSNPLSRRTSEEDNNTSSLPSAITSGQHTPEHIDYSDLELNKVPSYSTAVRTPARGASYAEVVPKYDDVLSSEFLRERTATMASEATNGSHHSHVMGNILEGRRRSHLPHIGFGHANAGR